MNDYSAVIRQDLTARLSGVNHLGLFLSGGYDSTTLAYIISDIITINKYNCVITVFTVPRQDASIVHSNRVVDWLMAQFPGIISQIKECGNPRLSHSEQVLSGVIEILNDTNVNCDLLILGDTLVPAELQSEYAPIRIRSNNSRVYQPLFDYDKRTVILLAESLGKNISDNISRLSHTCTESTDLRCGQCWQCGERRWAFNNVNIFDSGTR